MCHACDIGLECENGPASSCNTKGSFNPLVAAASRGGSVVPVAPTGKMAAGCSIGVAPVRQSGATALQRQTYAFDPKRYIELNRRMGYSSDYRRGHRYAGNADDTQGQRMNPPTDPPPPARRVPWVPLALGAAALAILWSTAK